MSIGTEGTHGTNGRNVARGPAWVLLVSIIGALIGCIALAPVGDRHASLGAHAHVTTADHGGFADCANEHDPWPHSVHLECLLDQAASVTSSGLDRPRDLLLAALTVALTAGMFVVPLGRGSRALVVVPSPATPGQGRQLLTLISVCRH